MNVKLQNQKKHFKKRFEERLETPCTRSKRREILYLITQNKLELYRQQSNRVLIFIYPKNEKNYLVVYDKNRNTLVSIFEKIEYQNERQQD
jgi:hypothetical protein